MTDLEASLREIEEKMGKACARAGRNPEDVKLIAVTKTLPRERVEEAIRCGLTDFGENYIQEARDKIDQLGAKNVRWHMIGHVQTNKAKYIPGRFSYVHSVDSPELLEKLDGFGASLKVLFELNLSRETTKHGTDEDGLRRMLDKTTSLQHIEPVGLMTMAPVADNAEKVRGIFSSLRQVLERINHEFSLTMKELSMGMSSDFEVAIEEGATMVRIGTALFGARS